MTELKPIGPLPGEIRKRLLRKWEGGAYFSPHEGIFPLRVPLGTISASALTNRFEDVRRWIALYQDGSGECVKSCRVEWKEINHRLLGRNRLPQALIFDTSEDLARFLGRTGELRSYRQLRNQLAEAHEKLAEWAREAPFDLLACSHDLEKLILLWRWMADHPRPNIYLRQIDLFQIDTKFTEKYKRILSTWLDLTLSPEFIESGFTGIRHFEERYGYKKKPELIGMRFLDPALTWFGCSRITLDADSFCRLFGREPDKLDIPPRPEYVFVVENDITALAFPPVTGGMVIFGRGYYFDHWRKAQWLNKVNLWYWGDLDTHGFCILDQFREIFPHTRSFLMDRQTFLDHESSRGEEAKPSNQDLIHLRGEEKTLYDDLRFNRLGKNLRLEQEFIGFSALQRFLGEQGYMA